MKRVMTTYQAVYADARLPRSLPMRLALAGFSSISAESFVVLNTSFGEDTYTPIGRVRNFHYGQFLGVQFAGASSVVGRPTGIRKNGWILLLA
jgi:hypothetical protein